MLEAVDSLQSMVKSLNSGRKSQTSKMSSKCQMNGLISVGVWWFWDLVGVF